MISLDNYDIYFFLLMLLVIMKFYFELDDVLILYICLNLFLICIDYIEKVSIYNLFFFVVSFLKNFE